MKLILRLSAICLLVLTVSCNNSDKNSSTADASTFSCSVKRSGELTICTQYQDLSGSTLTAIRSECELRSNEGFSWAVAACPASTVGACSLPETAQKPAPGTQYFYGAGFGSGAAAGMCDAQGGTFKEAASGS